MPIDEAQLMAVLRIGHDTSMRGGGLSLRDALARTEYSRLRPQFEPVELVPFMRANPDLVMQWLMYCEDKRTSGGFWVNETTFQVESLGAPDSVLRYESLEEAVAQFVVRELDYWSKVGDSRTSRCT